LGYKPSETENDMPDFPRLSLLSVMLLSSLISKLLCLLLSLLAFPNIASRSIIDAQKTLSEPLTLAPARMPEHLHCRMYPPAGFGGALLGTLMLFIHLDRDCNHVGYLIYADSPIR
jgi:hypothetical protein